jgi:hypothetical protein
MAAHQGSFLQLPTKEKGMSQDVLTSSSGQSQVLNEVRQEAASNEVYFVDSSLDAEAWPSPLATIPESLL